MIFQDSQDSAMMGNPVHPEKSCSSCPFFAVRLRASDLQHNERNIIILGPAI